MYDRFCLRLSESRRLATFQLPANMDGSKMPLIRLEIKTNSTYASVGISELMQSACFQMTRSNCLADQLVSSKAGEAMYKAIK